MSPVIQQLLRRWHSFLRLPRHPPSWYKDRLREELAERRLAITRLDKLSETADVFYIVCRSQHDGRALRPLPAYGLSHLRVYAYMLAKYTSRWQFYRVAASLAGCVHTDAVREVVNPSKDYKVRGVASRHGLDPAIFQRVCRRLRTVWPLLP